MKLTTDITNALTTRAETDGHHLRLTGPRMDPRLYQRIDDVLQGIGGRWDRAVQAHVFPTDAAAAMAALLAAGEVVTPQEKRQSAQYFPTPAAVVQRLIDLAGLTPDMTVLEPSAGSGAIAGAVSARGAAVDCIEQDPGYAAVLADAGHAPRVADFLTVIPECRYDRVIMNPPFTRGADIAHVQHALRFLTPDGLLVSVMSWTVIEHHAKTAGFRALVEARGGSVEAVEPGAFRESGTDVRTVIVAIPATRQPGAAPTVWPERQIAEPPAPEFGDPAEIAAEISSLLLKAAAEFGAVAVALSPLAAPKQTTVVNLPAFGGQLAFDEAS